MLCRSVVVCGCSCLVLGSVVSSREKKIKRSKIRLLCSANPSFGGKGPYSSSSSGDWRDGD